MATTEQEEDRLLLRIAVGGLVTSLVLVLVVLGVLAFRCQDAPAYLVGLAGTLAGAIAGLIRPRQAPAVDDRRP